MKRNRNAKIIATLGPASSDPKVIRALFEAGVDVFRLNFSHGTHDDHSQRHAEIRRLEQEYGRPVGILLDLQGPKLRLGTFENGSAELAVGARFRLDLDTTPGSQARAPLPHPEIFQAIKPGSELLLDDGKIRLRVEESSDSFAETVVLAGGRISDRKGVNVPGSHLPISPLTKKDRADLAFGLELGVDWVALSFVQCVEDIEEARALVGDRAWIMAKLEKPLAIDHLEGIVQRCDGVMVARGDLGVELPAEQIPELQRRIIRECRRVGRVVVVATQMLESMTNSPVPTRAETSDVAGAIYEGADAVMLSAESAAGKYPVQTIEAMAAICVEAEKSEQSELDKDFLDRTFTRIDQSIAMGALFTAYHLGAKAIVALTESGSTALWMSRHWTHVPIFALTPRTGSERAMSLYRNVTPLHLDTSSDRDTALQQAIEVVVSKGYASRGDMVVLTVGEPMGQPGGTNTLKIVRVGDVF